MVSACVSSRLELFSRFSSLSRLKRVVAYCLRFKNNCIVAGSLRISGQLSVDELEQAMSVLIRTVQSEEFALEKSDLQNQQVVHTKSKLITLNPFLDSKNIIRVGGRFRHANIDYSRTNEPTDTIPITNANETKFLESLVSRVHHSIAKSI